MKYCKDNDIITENFIKTFISEVNYSKNYLFDLQNLDDKELTNLIKSYKNKFFLGISRYKKSEIKFDLPDTVHLKIGAIRKKRKDLLDFKLFLRSIIKDILENINIDKKLKDLSEKLEWVELYSQFGTDAIANYSLLSYLDDLSSGSRPDAWIINKECKLVILIETKIHGELIQVQNDRHISVHLGQNHFDSNKNYKLITWKEIYNFFEKKDLDYAHNNLLINQFVKYLKLIGMGPIKFTEKDFNSFGSSESEDINLLYTAHENLNRLLSEIFSDKKDSNLKVNNRKFNRNFLGVELSEFEDINSQVLHYTIILSENELSVHIIIETKPLIGKLLKKIDSNKEFYEEKLKKLFQEMPSIKSYIEPQVKIYEKWYFIQGKSYYYEDLLLPVKDVFTFVPLILQRLKSLYNNTHRKMETKRFFKEKNYRARSVYPTLQINYEFNNLFVVAEEYEIKNIINDALKNLEPVYLFLKEILHDKN